MCNTGKQYLEALKVPRHYPLILLTKVGWGYGKVLRYRRQVTEWYIFGKQQTIGTEQ
jgi:hypothetical protein